MSFNEQLAKLRKRKNIKQYDFANQMGVKQYVISSWETGRSEPSIAQIIKLCDLLDVPADYLLDRPIVKVSSETDFDKMVENMKMDIKEDYLRSINDICENFPKEKKEKIVNIIKELSEL